MASHAAALCRSLGNTPSAIETNLSACSSSVEKTRSVRVTSSTPHGGSVAHREGVCSWQPSCHGRPSVRASAALRTDLLAPASLCRHAVRLGGGVRIPRACQEPLSRQSKKTACALAEHSASVEVEEAALPSSSSSDLASASGGNGSAAAPRDCSRIVEWEMDFCSRPILDARGKKVWELLVCDSSRTLEHSEYFPNNKINSVTLKDAIIGIMQRTGAPKPEKVRFFRSQMQTIISKACSELDIQPVPSQRCLTLVRWLDDRYESVYAKEVGFQKGATPLLLVEQGVPQDLPDTLRGEKWAFVQLPLSAVRGEVEGVQRNDVFGGVFDIDSLFLGLPEDAMIPGIAVASARAIPLAAWTNALELANIRVDTQRACLILSTGVAESWRYAFYRRSKQADLEAQAWEAVKKSVKGLHFLAVQRDLEEDDCTGFWLLQDVEPPRV